MDIIHIHKTIDSETLHLPELKPVIGHTVEILVFESPTIPKIGAAPNTWLPGFWDEISHGWQGEPLVRPDQGACDARDPLR